MRCQIRGLSQGPLSSNYFRPNSLDNSLSELLSGAVPAQIRRYDPASHGFDDRVIDRPCSCTALSVVVLLAEPIKHHTRREDRLRRVCDSSPRDVRSRAAHGLEYREIIAYVR